jgi:protein TonB
MAEQHVKRLQDMSPLITRIALIASFALMLLMMWTIPSPKPTPYRPKKIRDVNIDVVEQTEVIQEPTEPQVIQKPKQVVEAEPDEEIDEEATIADTDLDLDQKAVDTTIPPPDAFIPYSNAPVTLSKPKPEYPEMARKAQLEGRVSLKVYVDVDGSVRDVVLLKGISPALDQAAMKAALKAKFKPAENNGVPVGVWWGFTYTFTLH